MRWPCDFAYLNSLKSFDTIYSIGDATKHERSICHGKHLCAIARCWGGPERNQRERENYGMRRYGGTTMFPLTCFYRN